MQEVNPVQTSTPESQQLHFENSAPGDKLHFGDVIDSSFDDGMLDAGVLDKFLERPVLIQSLTWTEGTLFSTIVRPWADYFNNTVIKRKLENYCWIRCTLNLEIQVKASPFFHGKFFASYRPLSNFGHAVPLTAGSDEQLVSHSQHPHILCDVSKSQGGCMQLPFFYHKPWLDLTTLQQFTDMGALELQSPVVLRNANGIAGDDVQVKVFAYATNVHLSGLTTSAALQSSRVRLPLGPAKPTDNSPPFPAGHRPVVLPARTQSSKVSRKGKKGVMKPKDNSSVPDNSSWFSRLNSGYKDEYGKGVVSSVASAAANSARMLSSVPQIGPFATATGMGLDAVANIAEFFGFTNAPVLDNVTPFKDVPFHALASPDISTPMEKLGIDPKNELSVDSRTVGLDGTDELSIESLVTRQSYLVSTNWDQTDVSGHVLFNTVVHPFLHRRSGTLRYLTPMGQVQEMFRFWRGGMKFTLDAYKTPYHGGSLLVAWEPDNDTANNGTSLTENFSIIWDIRQNDSLVVEIPWNQDYSFLETESLMDTALEGFFTTGAVFPGYSDRSNGTLTVTVLNPLTAPVSTNSLDIAISVAGCSDMTFAAPRNISNLLVLNADAQSSLTPIEGMEEVPIAQLGENIEPVYLSNFGEVVMSIRSLLRRTSHYRSMLPASNTTAKIHYVRWTYPRYPVQPGYDANGLDETSVFARYNYVGQTAYTWMAPAFIGQRGSMKYRVNVKGPADVADLQVSRESDTLTTTHFSSEFIVPGVSPNEFQWRSSLYNKQRGMTGKSLTNQKTQTGMAVEIPLYSNHRMLSTVGGGIGQTYDGSRNDSLVVNFSTRPAETSSDSSDYVVDLMYAVGTDFTFFFYINAPVVHRLGSIPTGSTA